LIGASESADSFGRKNPLEIDADMSRDLRTMTYEELVKIGMMMPRDNENDANIPNQRPISQRNNNG